MCIRDRTNTANNIDNNVIPHPNTIPSGAGVVQGRIYMKLFIPKISTNALNIHTFKIGATINGIKNIGFKINGAPNKIGSLTPNNTGTELALPTALNSLDFAMKANINVKMCIRDRYYID